MHWNRTKNAKHELVMSLEDQDEFPEEFARRFYHPICSDQEIDRIFDVKSAKDFLLKTRANTAVDNMRLFRFFLNVRRIRGKKYSFEKALDDSHYKFALTRFTDKIQRRCSNVVYGDIFSNRPNGVIFKSDFGPILSLSYSLRYFLKFSHLAMLDFDEDVPQYVRFNALRIAIRVMLQKEALDFLQDPRGIIPNSVAKKIHEPIKWQQAFIVAHEFGHYILGHLNENETRNSTPIFSSNSGITHDSLTRIYSHSEQKEFAADLWAISNFKTNDLDSEKLADAVILWFVSLELFELVDEQISPKFGWQSRTHPPARDRLEALVKQDVTVAQRWELLKKGANSQVNLCKDFPVYPLDACC